MVDFLKLEMFEKLFLVIFVYNNKIRDTLDVAFKKKLISLYFHVLRPINVFKVNRVFLKNKPISESSTIIFGILSPKATKA